ncbi:MAG: type IV pili methyl-accepting chemotaxis transducer N-terminal domain-containing protein [Comamonadaceae bacterium]|nr:type IV pili methyl-accepting chemotaxis transducer N-terminal domain-containing protein [Comamonadaceae bacterium]
MAVVDQLKHLFKKKGRESDTDSRLGGGQPDVSMYQLEAELKSSQTQYGPPEIVAPYAEGVPDAAELLMLPFLGKKTVAQHQRVLWILLIGLALVLAVLTFVGLSQSGEAAQQMAATGQALTQSQRLAKSASQAVLGDAKAFAEVSQSSQIIAKSIHGLMSGDSETGLKAVGGDNRAILDKAEPLADSAEKNAAVVVAQQKALVQMGTAIGLITRQSQELLNLTESILSLKLQQGASAAEVAAVGRLTMLTQRIDKASHEFLTADGVRPETVFLLGKDLDAFKQNTSALLEGSPELRLAASSDPQVRERLTSLSNLFVTTNKTVDSILTNFKGLVSARAAQIAIMADSEPLRNELESLQSALAARTALGAGLLTAMAIVSLLAVLSAMALFYVQLLDSRQRQVNAEVLRLEAQGQEQEAKRVNDANQAAILRLMNELQAVSEGDLTQQATVTEDITGAIADSVNYTVEELRSLVGSVQNTVSKVAQTTADVDVTSTELLAASNEQLHEIRETGRSVVDMATRINQVSTQAQESAAVARQSLKAAEEGLHAVENAIGGMNTIRDQIQDTSKRIKRLGESSQEIGEITELISDITEQTNVLALNAAIQAASAGDAGRGFSVVAEEVQRLAERSADATRQIAALVKAIQTDTQDAVGAMERSTQGVVEGAKLSDNAGTALTQIDKVSRRLAELIAHISASTLQEANLANELAGNIQHIFAVTEQTGEGTRSTAAQVRELSRMAEELRQSVARFRIA